MEKANKKIVEVFIDTDSESESSENSSRDEGVQSRTPEKPQSPITPSPPPSSPPLPSRDTRSPSPMNEETESNTPTLHDQQVASHFYEEGASENVSLEEADINFQDPLDDPMDIIEDSMATILEPTVPNVLEEKPISEEQPVSSPVQSSKVVTKDDSPPPDPKPIDPTKNYCFCQQPPDSLSMIYCYRCLEWFHGECVGLTRQKAACIKRFYCPLCIDKDPSLVSTFESRADSMRQQAVGQVKNFEKKLKNKKHSRRCGECVACLTDVDCRKCRFCRDMSKYGGRGSLRQKCIRRQCRRYSRILHTEDPIYTKSPVIQEELAAELEAVGGDISPHIQREADVKIPDVEDDDKNIEKEYLPPPPAKKKLSVAKKGKSSSKGSVVRGGAKGKSVQKGRSVKQKTKTLLGSSDFDFEDVALTSRRSRKPFSDIVGVGSYYGDEGPMQCQGPECVFPAQPHSKYCSEECGVQLAIRRIRKHLPRQKQLWEGSQSRATRRNEEKLEKLEEEQKAIKKRLKELDEQTIIIDNHVQRLSSIPPINEDETDADSDDLMIHCATCGQPVTLKKAMAHFERCFNKLEGMVSFGSIVKNEETKIFCDRYDSVQKTYCKRLRVLCPEHTKEPKIGSNDVCGCPLEALFPSKLERSQKFCRLPKKSCATHYCWEKLRKGEIDQEKLNLYLKLEELSEASRLNQWQINCRSSLLAIVLHHSMDHELATPTDHTHNHPIDKLTTMTP